MSATELSRCSEVVQGLVPWCLGRGAGGQVGELCKEVWFLGAWHGVGGGGGETGVQGGLAPRCPRVVQEYSVLSTKELKVYGCAKGCQQSHAHVLKKEKHFLLTDRQADQKANTDSSGPAGLWGLGMFWSFTPQGKSQRKSMSCVTDPRP